MCLDQLVETLETNKSIRENTRETERRGRGKENRKKIIKGKRFEM